MTNRWQFGIGADGRPIHAYELRSDTGFQAIILNNGSILQSFRLPSGRNVTLGFEDWGGYEKDKSYKGRIIGPNANRIAKARFQIDEQRYQLTANDGPHNLHSGPHGFDSEIWETAHTAQGLRLELESPEQRHGFPGTIHATLNISLKGNILRLEMQATTDRPTPMNLTWHPYWNLSNSPRIDGHTLEVDAKAHTRLEICNPVPVKDTFRDFSTDHPLGNVKLDCSYENVKRARLTGGATTMTITSSLPNFQVYTGDSLPRPRAGIALEPQYRPNDINFVKNSLLRPGETYQHWIEYRFDVA